MLTFLHLSFLSLLSFASVFLFRQLRAVYNCFFALRRL